MNSNYYEILGVLQNATQEEIKKAYLTLAKKCHPDHHPGNKAAEEQFKKIAEAYSVLKNEDSRKQYDKKLSGQYMTDEELARFDHYIRTIRLNIVNKRYDLAFDVVESMADDPFVRAQARNLFAWAKKKILAPKS